MKYLLLLCGLFCSGIALAEDVQPASTSLPAQYKSLTSDCEVIDGYRMLKLYKMDAFWKVVMDSIALSNQKIDGLVLKQQDLEKTIKMMSAKLETSEKARNEVTEQIDNLVVFGKQYPKAGFVSITFIVIAGLSVLTVVLFLASKATFKRSKELKLVNDALHNEFEQYKHQSVEKQIKLSRELQDYRNRLAELKVK